MEDSGLLAFGMDPKLAQRIGFSCGSVTAAGTTYADATRCYKFSVVDGAASAGVILPTLDVGEFCVIRNAGSGDLLIYSATSTETFYIAGSNTAAAGQSTGVTIAQYYTAFLVKISATEIIACELIGA